LDFVNSLSVNNTKVSRLKGVDYQGTYTLVVVETPQAVVDLPVYFGVSEA